MTTPATGRDATNRGDAWTRIAPLVFAVLAAALALLSSWNASPTDDEPTYIGQGAYIARSRDFEAPVLLWQPPLALYVTSSALPLVSLPPDAFAARPPSDSLTALGDRLLMESPSPTRAVLRASRVPVAIAFGLLAALAVWLARRLGGSDGGPLAGTVAGGLVAASPMLYSHGGLATTDIVATGAALLAVTPIALASLPGRVWTARRSLVAGAALGVALMAKHTAIVLVPIAVVAAALLVRRSGPSGERASWRRAAGLAALVLLAAAIVLWAGYGFDAGLLVGAESKGDLAARVAPNLPGVEWIARNVPVPAPRWFQSLVFQASKQHDRLYFHYFGEARKLGWWSYFPVVALGKATLGSIVLAGIAAWTLRRRRPDAAEWVLLAAFALPFAAAVVSRHNLGVRHVLPAVAPLCVLVGVRIGRDGIGSVARVGAVGAMLLLHLAEGFFAVPDGLAWWNLAAGGAEGGWRIAVQSNADWGQGFYRLIDEAKARGLGEVHVMATSGPARFVNACDVPPLHLLRDASRKAPLPETGWLAISTSAWRAAPHDPVTDAKPDLFIGGCWRLYRLPLQSARTP
ncbi:MAG: hypothetical protein K8T90_02200 [Planctomycetes bacterium]|nr:hypothetical protein [Planctomycetota bacterium]